MPTHYLKDNYTKLHHLRNKTKSVGESTNEFERLIITCDLWEREDQNVVRYMGGLSESIQTMVELQHYTTLHKFAYKVKLQKKAKLKREPPKPLQRNKGILPPPYNR